MAPQCSQDKAQPPWHLTSSGEPSSADETASDHNRSGSISAVCRPAGTMARRLLPHLIFAHTGAPTRHAFCLPSPRKSPTSSSKLPSDSWLYVLGLPPGSELLPPSTLWASVFLLEVSSQGQRPTGSHLCINHLQCALPQEGTDILLETGAGHGCSALGL